MRAYRIADNQAATIAARDFEILPIELKDLQTDGFDLGLLGFDEDAFAQMLAPIDAAGLIDPNAIPESRDPVDPIRDPPTQLLHRDP